MMTNWFELALYFQTRLLQIWRSLEIATATFDQIVCKCAKLNSDTKNNSENKIVELSVNLNLQLFMTLNKPQ